MWGRSRGGGIGVGGKGGYLELFTSDFDIHMAVGMDGGVGVGAMMGVGRVVGKGAGDRL